MRSLRAPLRGSERGKRGGVSRGQAIYGGGTRRARIVTSRPILRPAPPPLPWRFLLHGHQMTPLSPLFSSSRPAHDTLGAHFSLHDPGPRSHRRSPLTTPYRPHPSTPPPSCIPPRQRTASPERQGPPQRPPRPVLRHPRRCQPLPGKPRKVSVPERPRLPVSWQIHLGHRKLPTCR